MAADPPEQAAGPDRSRRDDGDAATLAEVVVADPPESWTAAGFTVDGDEVRVGVTTIRLVGRTEGSKGIRHWTLAGLARADGAADDEPVDGLPTTTTTTRSAGDAPGPTRVGGGEAPGHANGATGIDHVVVLSPDFDRTTAAFAPLGLGVRRIRETASYGAPMRQAFLRVGPTLIEVVGLHEGSGRPAADDPAGWFGLALDVDDLDATAGLLGDHLGRVKPAVQKGRRIATLRHRQLGLSVPLAFMDRRAASGSG